MGGKNFVGSFSYNIKDSETIDEAMRLAKGDGISFSEFIVSLVKQEVRKKPVGEETPIRIRYGRGKNNPFPFQMTLDAWTTRIAAVQNIKDMDAQLIENIGLNMIYASRLKKTGVARDVRVY